MLGRLIERQGIVVDAHRDSAVGAHARIVGVRVVVGTVIRG